LEATPVPLNNDSMRRLLVESGVAVFDAKSGLFTPRIDAQAALDTLDTALRLLPEAPCIDCTPYLGTLSGTYDLNIQPDGTYYASPAGTHNGWLRGPAQRHFALYLLQWSGFRWVTAAKSHETGSEAFATYQGRAGYYAWVIISQEGRGSYQVWLQRP
jgi:hypothetical protein